jgi:CheY-like chemotaxis protein
MEGEHGFAPLRVVVVDDCTDAADSLALLLEIWGHEARVAADGRAALALVSTFCPDVVFLDLSMPGMDGLAVSRELRRRHGPGWPLVVAYSGYGRDADRLRALEAGCDQYLLKPADPESLQLLLAAFRPRPRSH